MAAITWPSSPTATVATSALLYASIPLAISSAELQLLKTSRKASSLLHGSLIGFLGTVTLWQHREAWFLTSPPSGSSDVDASSLSGSGTSERTAQHPLINTRSALANAITALEAGYLLSDTLLLLVEALHRARPSPAPRLADPHSLRRYIAALDSRNLLLHHVPITALLLLLQSHISHDRDRGILIIALLLTSMSLPTPVRDAVWLLKRYRPAGQVLIGALNGVWLLSFLVFRVLVWWGVLRGYGRFYSEGAQEVFRGRLLGWCRAGVCGFVGLNGVWWVLAVRKWMRGRL